MAVDTQTRIMVIDDDMTVLDLMVQMLVVLGYAATPIGSGIKALERFRGDHFQLVLTDLQMPIIDGWELARRLKQEHPWIPVIAVTGQGREAVLEKLGGSGIERVLFKPFSIELLGQVVKTAIARPYPLAARKRFPLMEKFGPERSMPQPAIEETQSDEEHRQQTTGWTRASGIPRTARAG